MLGPRETRPGDVAAVTETLVPRGSASRGIADNLELAAQAVTEPAVVELGPEARALADRDASADAKENPTKQPFRDYPLYGKAEESNGEARSFRPPNDLTEEEQEELEELKARDREVRAHELAHKATAGPYAGQITYELERGPDGRSYAVAGEVPIDVSPVTGDPTATVTKMERVRRAALGPADPSGADHHVAARAAQEAERARLELAQQRYGGSDRASERPEGQPPDHRTDLATQARLSVDVRA